MSAVRAAPWRSKPSEELQALVTQLSQPSSAGNSNSSWYVLQRLGPSSFVVGQDPGGDKFRAALGNQPTCSCRATASCSQEPCVHLLFIMLRVMRLAADNPLLWQSALTDRELQELLDGRLSSSRGNAGRAAGRRMSSSSSSSGKAGSSVQRRTVEQDEPCPICYESLSNVDAAWLVWCSNSCGKSIHGRCMRVWSDHQTKTLQQELSCPLCRCPWGRLDWTPPAVPAAAAAASGKAAAHARNCHKGVSCSGCNQSPIEGSRYRCLECAATNLCHACFTAGQHLQHSFVCCATPSAPEQLAERPIQLGLQCNGLAQGAAVELVTVHHNGSRVRSSEGVAHQNSRGRLPAGSSSSSGSTAPGRHNNTCSNAVPAAAEHSMRLELQCSSLVHAAHSAPQASGSSSSRTSSRGDAGQHDASKVDSRHDHSSSQECQGKRSSSSSIASPSTAAAPATPGAAAAARAAAAVAAVQQADQGNAVVDSLGLRSAGMQLSSSSSSRSSSTTGSSASSSRSSSSGGCQRKSSRAVSRASLAAGSKAPARTCRHLYSGCRPSDELQIDFAALMLSGHAAPTGGRRAAAIVESAATGGQELLGTEAGTAAISRAAVAAASHLKCGSSVRQVGLTAKARCGLDSAGKREVSDTRTRAYAAAQPEQQQLSLTVCGLGAHLATH